MKKNIKVTEKASLVNDQEKKITRKQAIKKTGLIAVSALTMMMLLSDNAKAQATTSTPGGGPGDNGWN